MGETETPHVYDFGTLGRVLSSQNQLCSSLETPGYFKQSKKNILCKNICWGNLKDLEIEHLSTFEKDGHRQIPTIRLMNS